MEEVSGYKLSEVVGQNWFDVFLPQRDRDTIRAVFARSIAGNPTKGNVNAIVTKDGRERRIEWFDKTLSDAEGRVIGILATGQDITERTKAEEAMKQANLELVQANKDLKDMHAQLIQNEKLASIGQLAAGVAHGRYSPLLPSRRQDHLLINPVRAHCPLRRLLGPRGPCAPSDGS